MSEIRIGTRGSPLALAQAEIVRAALIKSHRLDRDVVAISAIKTTGDRIQDKKLAEIGGKGLFTKEIEDALLKCDVDLAVHSMKDVPTMLPEGLEIAVVLKREDARDAFISPAASTLMELKPGCVVGTSSLRRHAQVKQSRPDIEVVEYRGNVDTRLRKLKAGEVDATYLACAGLKRLGLAGEITTPVEIEDMLPAVAQGAIGIEIRTGDDAIGDFVRPLNDRGTADCIALERAFLEALDGSCRTPIAGHARLEGGQLVFRGMIITPDGRTWHETGRSGSRNDAAALGSDAGEELKRRGGRHFFDGV